VYKLKSFFGLTKDEDGYDSIDIDEEDTDEPNDKNE